MNGPELYKRNQYGLLENAQYIFNDDGSVNWREMIKPEFLYVNKEWFEMRKLAIPSSTEGLKDRQLLILLGGIKELAKLRGFTDLRYDLTWLENKNHVAACCKIDWIGNYETNEDPVHFEDFANASIDNTDAFCHKFLETIACNRAFIRCVRNFLNIHIVGADEIDKSEKKGIGVEDSDPKENLSVLKPSGLLEKHALAKGIADFDGFLNWLRELWQNSTYRNDDTKNWTSYKQIPAKECRKLMAILNDISEFPSNSSPQP